MNISNKTRNVNHKAGNLIQHWHISNIVNIIEDTPKAIYFKTQHPDIHNSILKSTKLGENLLSEIL